MAKKPSELGTAEKFVEVALKEVGVVEGPKDNQTKYGAFTGANFVPWCGSFVMWCANQAGFKLPGSTVYTPSGADAFKKAKSWSDAEDAKPLPGDVVYFDFPSDDVHRISHVGIVIKDNGDGTVTTVEGNTSGAVGDQRNGGMVQKKIRGYKKNKKGVEVSIVGFGRPKFPGPVKAIKPKAEKPHDPAAYPNDPIQPGETGEYVKVIQKALGFTGKDVDGQYGPVTKKAVVAWQKANPTFGDADGIIGPKSFAALKKLAEKPVVAKPTVAKTASVASPKKADEATLSLPIKNGKITTPYKKKGRMWSKGYHTGVDFAVPEGTTVIAAADGKIESGNWGSAYGTHVIQKVAQGWVIYAHLSKSLVKPGQKVKRGQVIGKTGNTGNSSGPHLHFELRDNIRWSAGKDLDPKL
jgi:hypothetical protein